MNRAEESALFSFGAMCYTNRKPATEGILWQTEKKAKADRRING